LTPERPIIDRMPRFDFQEIIERLPLVVYIDNLDERSSPLYVSPEIQRLLGYTREEWLADPDLFSKSLHPEDHDRVMAAIDERNRSGAPIGYADYRLIARTGASSGFATTVPEDPDPRHVGLRRGDARRPARALGPSLIEKPFAVDALTRRVREALHT
jgi:PAS domain-containing protein